MTIRLRLMIDEMTRKRVSSHQKASDGGFSLIELIVVVLIIGTISAIAIPVYQGVQASAIESSLKSDLRNSAMQLEEYQMRHGDYPQWRDSGDHLTISKDNYHGNSNFLYCTNGDEYGIFVFGEQGNRYQYSSTYGFRDDRVSSSSSEACPQMGVTGEHESAWLKHQGEWRV